MHAPTCEWVKLRKNVKVCTEPLCSLVYLRLFQECQFWIRYSSFKLKRTIPKILVSVYWHSVALLFIIYIELTLMDFWCKQLIKLNTNNCYYCWHSIGCFLVCDLWLAESWILTKNIRFWTVTIIIRIGRDFFSKDL